MTEWTSPGLIVFNKDQVKWLLPYLYDLREGLYPSREGEVDARLSHRSNRYMSPFIQAAEIGAELDARLAMCSLDRELVEHFYCTSMTDRQVAIRYHMTEDKVRSRIDKAVRYISSGTCRRWIDCKPCYRYKRCRKRKRNQRKPVRYQDWS